LVIGSSVGPGISAATATVVAATVGNVINHAAAKRREIADATLPPAHFAGRW
jgi:hypothetical protein